jgi:hypothetical protein
VWRVKNFGASPPAAGSGFPGLRPRLRRGCFAPLQSLARQRAFCASRATGNRLDYTPMGGQSAPGRAAIFQAHGFAVRLYGLLRDSPGFFGELRGTQHGNPPRRSRCCWRGCSSGRTPHSRPHRASNSRLEAIQPDYGNCPRCLRVATSLPPISAGLLRGYSLPDKGRTWQEPSQWPKGKERRYPPPARGRAAFLLRKGNSQDAWAFGNCRRGYG